MRINNDEQEARESAQGKRMEIEGRATAKFSRGGDGSFSGAVHADRPVSVSQSRGLTVAKPLPL